MGGVCVGEVEILIFRCMKFRLLFILLFFNCYFFYAQTSLDSLRLVLPMGHSDYLQSANYSPDGKLIVTASEDNSILIWESRTGKLLRTLIGHTDKVKSAFFSPDGEQIFSISNDSTIRLWLTKSGKLLHKIKLEHENVSSSIFSPDGQKIIFTPCAEWCFNDSIIEIWSTKNGQKMYSIEKYLKDIQTLSVSENNLLVTYSFDSVAVIFNLNTGEIIQKINCHSWINMASFSPDRKFIITASMDKQIRLWETYTGKLLKTFEDPNSGLHSFVFSPDEKRLLMFGENSIFLWNYIDGKNDFTLNNNLFNIKSAIFSPNGKNILALCNDSVVRILNSNSGRLICKSSA